MLPKLDLVPKIYGVFGLAAAIVAALFALSWIDTGNGAGSVRIASTLLTASGLVVIAIAAISTARTIVGPITAMTPVLGELGRRNTAVEIPGLGRTDEIGRLADAVQVFKDNIVRRVRNEGEARAEQERAKEEQRRMLADTFEQSIGHVVRTIGRAATEFEAAAETMAAAAEETNQQAATVASAVAAAAVDVHNVAGTCENLAWCVRDIGRQVAASTDTAEIAVTGAEKTSETVKSLVAATEKIDSVVDLIREIASQTKLLALNATIESAKAGDAGKGFAVVANEVKSLASQTAKATGDIADQIGAVQGVTKATMQSIDNIRGVIAANRNVAVEIARAVEEQDVKTGEIARTLQNAALGTSEMSKAIAHVTQAAAEGGSAAAQVLASAKQLAGTADHLNAEASRFLNCIRAA